MFTKRWQEHVIYVPQWHLLPLLERWADTYLRDWQWVHGRNWKGNRRKHPDPLLPPTLLSPVSLLDAWPRTPHPAPRSVSGPASVPKLAGACDVSEWGSAGPHQQSLPISLEYLPLSPMWERWEQRRTIPVLRAGFCHYFTHWMTLSKSLYPLQASVSLPIKWGY